MSCGMDPERLADLIDGDLTSAETTEVEAHIAGCEVCRAEYRQLTDLADLYRSVRRPPAMTPDLVPETIRRLAATRTGRARRPGRRRRIVVRLMGAAAVAAAAAVLIAVLIGPGARTAPSEGLLFRYENNGWMWAGTEVDVHERCPHAAPLGPVRITLGDARVWLRRGTVVVVERITPPTLRLIGGTLRIRSGDDATVRVETPAGTLNAPPRSVCTVRCDRPVDPEEFRKSLESAGATGASLGSILMPSVSASASEARAVTVECHESTVSFAECEPLAPGIREIRTAAKGRVLRAPFSAAQASWTHMEEMSAAVAFPLANETGRPVLDVAADVLAGDDSELRSTVTEVLTTLAPAFGPREVGRVERWLTGPDEARAAFAARAIAARGSAKEATLEALRGILSRPGSSHFERATAVSILAAVDARASASALLEATAETDFPDVRLMATWGLLLARHTRGAERLAALLSSSDESLPDVASQCIGVDMDVLPPDVWRHLLTRANHPTVRRRAAMHLGYLGDRRDLENMIRLVEAPATDVSVCLSMCDALVRLAGPGDHPRLAELIQKLPPDRTRPLSVNLAIETRDPGVRRILIRQADLVSQDRTHILLSLAWNDEHAARVLLDALDEVPVELLHSTVWTLAERYGTAVRSAVDDLLRGETRGTTRWISLTKCLFILDAPAAGKLAREYFVASEPGDGRVAALSLLAQLCSQADRGPAFARTLIGGLEKASDRQRESICRALGRTGTTAQVTKVLRRHALMADKPNVRLAAVTALARRPGGRAAETLVRVALDAAGKPDLAIATLRSLVSMRRFPPRGEVLLESPDPGIRLWATMARTIADPSADPAPSREAFRRAPVDVALDLAGYVWGHTDAGEGIHETLFRLTSRSPTPRIRMLSASLAIDLPPARREEALALLASDTHWCVRLAAACTLSPRKSSIARVIAEAPRGVPATVRRGINKIVPVRTWTPTPSIPTWAADDGPVAEEVAQVIVEALKRGFDESGAFRSPDGATDDTGTRSGLRRALRLVDPLVRDSEPSRTSLIKLYRELASSLRQDLE
jgi:Putative zinc-finger